MRKTIVAALVAAPLVGLAAYAFAANGSVTNDTGVDALTTTISPAPSIAGNLRVHKRLSIKGIVIDDEDGLEAESEAEGDD
jgi:hypothetical protein